MIQNQNQSKMRIRIFFTFSLLLLYFLPSLMAQREDWNQLNIPDSPDPRKGHSLVTLPDGRVLMFGGEGPQVELFNNLFVFEDNQWAEIEPVNDPPPARSFHKSWMIGDDMYVFGGKGEGMVFNDMWVYDFVSSLWEEEVVTGSLPAGRYGHSVNLLPEGSAFIFGGKDENENRLKDAWLYENGGFVQKNDCILDYAYHNGHGFINNGVQMLRFYGISNILMTYDTDLESWELSAFDMPYSGHGGSISSQNFMDEDVVFIFGGMNINGVSTDIVYQYNCNTGELDQREEPLPGSVKDNAAAKYYYGNFSGRDDMYEVLLFGGEVEGELSNATWMSTSNLLSENEISMNDVFRLDFDPNPVNDQLYVKSKRKIERIFFYSIDGRLSRSLLVNAKEFSVLDLPENGVYIVRFQGPDHDSYHKLLVNK